MSNLPKRKHMRLKAYDYSQNGAYFITICSHQRVHLFGYIAVGQGLCSCRLSHIGSIIEREIPSLATRYSQITIDNFVIMPNHIHLIMCIARERQEQSPCPTVADVVCALKSITTKMANRKDHAIGRKIWQSGYYDHVIRNEDDYQNIWQYIDENPTKWAEDCYFE